LERGSRGLEAAAALGNLATVGSTVCLWKRYWKYCINRHGECCIVVGDTSTPPNSGIEASARGSTCSIVKELKWKLAVRSHV
jgi:hypothetical protein